MVLVINFSVMALVAAVMVFYATPLIDLNKLIQVTAFFWLLISIPGIAVIFIVILLKYIWNGIIGLFVLGRNLRNHAFLGYK